MYTLYIHLYTHIYIYVYIYIYRFVLFRIPRDSKWYTVFMYYCPDEAAIRTKMTMSTAKVCKYIYIQCV